MHVADDALADGLEGEVEMVAFPVMVGQAGPGDDIAKRVNAAADPALGFCHAQLVGNIDGDGFGHDKYPIKSFVGEFPITAIAQVKALAETLGLRDISH